MISKKENKGVDMTQKKVSLFMLMLLFAAMACAVDISIGSPVSQNFDVIGTSATASLPTDWKADKNTTARTVGTYTAAVSATELQGGNSMATGAQNGIWNLGAGVPASATDRSIGWLSSSTATKSGNLYVKLVNTGSAIGNFTISYDVEKYRMGTNSAGFSIQMYYSTDGSTWTSAGSDFLTSFTGGEASNNGYTTAPGATTSVTNKTLSQTLAISGTLYLAWNYAVTSGTTTSNAQCLAVDNVSITANSSGPAVATITTVAITSITPTSAVSGGTLVSDGGAALTAKGVCWNTGGTPTISDSHSSEGSGSSSFVSAITGLTASTTYHVRAYATNSQGTAYGDELTFVASGTSPPSAPVAVAATSVTSTSFVANWNTVSDATSYRLDVSTSNTFSSFVSGYNNLTVTGISQTVSGLSASTTYYYRVRAYNTYGTSANSSIITQATSADPYSGYYTPVNGLTGDALKSGLHTLIATNTNTSYDGSKAYMFQTLDNVSNVVRCVYTGKDYTVSSSYDGSSDPNTEHTFAQSWFGTTDASKKKADLHHLFPTNSVVNSSRGNLPFDVVTNVGTTFPSFNGYVSKRGTNAAGKTVFEPADQHKGDLARALLYFSVRYNMSLSIDGVDMLPTLITWNSADPVDTKESTRNANIYSFMGNRNPFVDHPEYVSSIWGGSTANTTIQFSPASAEVNENTGTVTLTVGILNPSSTTATTAQIQLTDGSSADVNGYTTQTITFPAGSSANQTITVTVTDDVLLEGDETLVFSLTNISGGTSASAGNYGSFNLTIHDNDIPSVTAIAATDVLDNSFTANWNAASGVTTYEFDLSTASDFSTYVNGYQAYQVTGTSIAVSGLTAGTNYYYRVRSFVNETAGTSSNIITTLTSGSAPITITEGFEGATNATPPTGWALTATGTGTGGAYIQTMGTNAHAGTNYAGTNKINGWVRTPLLTNPTQLTFWGRASGTTSNFTITIQTATSDSTSWNNVTTFVANGTDTGTMTSTYVQKTVDLNLTGSYWIRWYMTARSGGSLYFDDVEITSGSTTPTVPPAPVAIAATAPTTTGFTANWNAASTATSYRLDVSTSNTFASYVIGYEDLTVSGLTQAVTGLTASTTYYYRVRGVNATGTGDNSNVITATTSAVVTIPDAPVATTATGISSTGFTATWNASTGATSYRLDVSTVDTFASFVTGYNDLTVSGLTQAVTGLSAATPYYYRVRANNTAGTSGNSNTITATTLYGNGSVILSEGFEGSSTAIPPTGWGVSEFGSYIMTTAGNAHGGTNYAGTNKVNGWVRTPLLTNPTQLTFWGRTSGTTSNYTITLQVATADSASWMNVTTFVANGTDTGTITNNYSQKTVDLNLTGNYWLRWYMTVRSGGSLYFDDVEVTSGSVIPTVPSAPVAITATSITTTGFTANWNASTGATSYRLDVSTVDTFLSFVTGYNDLTVSGLSQAVSGLTAATTYYYRVRANNTAGTSDNSSTITVLTGTIVTGDLMISEYLEGSNTNKALEIYNPTSGAIDLSGYQVNLGRNGGAWSGTPISLAGSIAAGDVFVIVHPSSEAFILPYGDMTSSSLDFNGNDAVGLFKGTTTPVLIDVIGIPALGTGVPGVGWDVAGVTTATANHTLIRKLAVTQGNTNWATSAGTNTTDSEWLVYPIDTFSGLGLHNEPLTPPTAPVATAATDITTSGFTANWGAVATATSYRLDVSTSSSYTTYVTGYQDLTVSGLTQSVTGLAEGTTYYYQVRAYDGASTSANSNTITVTTGTTSVIPDVPVATDATGISTTGFTATWSAAANAESYRLDVSLVYDFSTYVTGYQDLTVSGLTQAVSGLTASTTYYYRVRAYSTAGTSANSNVITVITGTVNNTPDLFISEYIEGSNNNKAIEIYNPTGATVDLTQYSLKEAFNGADWTTTFVLAGTLAANDVFVAAHSSANATILAVADFTAITLNFNGNDAIGLFKNDVLIDVIGIPNLSTGVPGAGWDVAGTTTATKDHTIVRKSETIHGNIDWTASAGTNATNSEWIVYAVDTFTYLGSHTGPSASLDTPVVTLTTDSDNMFLTWSSIAGAASYRVEASADPYGSFTDVSNDGTFDEAGGIVSFKYTQIDNLRFFRVYAKSTAK